MCKSSYVYTFEPLPHYGDIIEANISVNNMNNKMALFRAGVSDSTGRTTIVFNGVRYDVEVTKLDDILDTFNNVGLVKIDVEGMESNVIRGAMKFLSKFKPRLFCEALNTEAMLEIDNLVCQLGYQRTANVFNASPTYEWKHPDGI
jgi:hypothetical protein